jgi:Predicted periplasmic lipoprotein
MTDGIMLSGSEGGSAQLQQQSSSLGQRVTLELKQLRRQDDRLELALKVKSNIAYDQSLQYKVDWFDEGGMPIEPDRAYWQPLILHGREEKVLRTSAPLSDATSFSFAVREIVKD